MLGKPCGQKERIWSLWAPRDPLLGNPSSAHPGPRPLSVGLTWMAPGPLLGASLLPPVPPLASLTLTPTNTPPSLRSLLPCTMCRWRCDSAGGLMRPRWGLPLGGLAYHPCPSTEGAGWRTWSSAPANGAAAPPDTLCKEDREGASGGGLKGENQFGIPLVRIRPSPHTSPPHGPHPPGVHFLRLRGHRGIATFS